MNALVVGVGGSNVKILAQSSSQAERHLRCLSKVAFIETDRKPEEGELRS